MDPFWSAALGALIGGVAVQYNQRRLDRKTQRDHYHRLRGAIVADVAHNLRVIDQMWKRAWNPYNTAVDADQVRMMIGNAQASHVGFSGPHFLQLETWDSAKTHLPAMADDPRDTVRFSRAFQLFKDALAFRTNEAEVAWGGGRWTTVPETDVWIPVKHLPDENKIKEPERP